MAGNRDEFHRRPAQPLARWDNVPGLIGGKDLQSGGMWLGVSEAGRFAVITNLRTDAGPVPDLETRGALVRDLVSGTGPYAHARPEHLSRFNAFNLFVATPSTAHFLTNHPGPTNIDIGEGIHALSNGPRDEPWHRKDLLHGAMADWIANDASRPETLFELLVDGRERPTDPRIDNLLPVFIRHDEYGTRASTVITINHEGEGRITERRFGPDGIDLGESSIAFQWPSSA